jgi:hypothetical protein
MLVQENFGETIHIENIFRFNNPLTGRCRIIRQERGKMKVTVYSPNGDKIADVWDYCAAALLMSLYGNGSTS